VSDKDVLGKADALLRRHAIPLPGAGSDAADVPLLTDAIEPPPPAPVPAEAEAGQAIFESVMKEVDSRLETGIAGLRQELAATIREAVRQELERRRIK
jgi:hypothetical protein